MVEPEDDFESQGIEASTSAESSRFSLLMFPMGESDLCHQPYRFLPFGTHSHDTTRLAQYNTTVDKGEQRQTAIEPVSRVSLDEIACFVRHATLVGTPHAGERHLSVAASLGSLYAKALTNWLRSVANHEPSRPIIDIEEDTTTAASPLRHGERTVASVSPGLQRETPPRQIGGLGYVSAGLLLWLDSSAEDDGDA